ncbi:E3 ubiquitin-protein ligase TRIM39-like [Pleurodeles waltl]|uniref:E3 ubiquitin-protein ligase TRIM39-like n=1 Tax=Pleurodeles waltl TaxID=8319 RepID=UPI003709A6BC
MAANKQLKEEAICSICLEYFTDPVAAECGHTYCLSCITQYWEGLETDFPCPQCRDTSKNKILRPIRQLGNIVELLKQLHTPSAPPQGENLCREHEEKLKLFCEDDQVTICVVCREAKEHRQHMVRPIPEAAQKYKKSLHDHVERLKKELKDLQTWTAEESRTAEELELPPHHCPQAYSCYNTVIWIILLQKRHLASQSQIMKHRAGDDDLAHLLR